MRERERRKRTEERTQKESAGCDSQCLYVCVCVLRSYVFALETLALDEPGREIESERERERDEEEMVIGVSSVADSFLFFIPKVAANLN